MTLTAFEVVKVMKPPLFVHFNNLVKTRPAVRLVRHALYSDNVVFFHLLTCFGLFPLRYNKNGNFVVEWTSWQWIYSFLYVILGSMLSVYGLNTFVKNFLTKSFGFELGVYYGIFLVFPAFHVIPILMILRAKKIVAYFNEWTKFIKHFEQITGRTVPNFKSYTWLILSLSGSITIFIFAWKTIEWFLGILERFKLDYSIHFIFLFLQGWTSLAIFFNVGLVSVVANCCKKISRDLLQDALNRYSGNQSFDDHLLLWFKLRQLCINFGNAFWVNYLYMNACMLGFSLPLIYISAEDLSKGDFIAFGVVCVPLITCLLLAEIAQGAVDAVGCQFENALSNAMLGRHHNSTLAKFAKTVASCPFKVSLGGFISLDRSLIVSIISTFVTYLIIIMQFRIQP